MNPNAKKPRRQALVDEVFLKCMGQDRRSKGDMITEIRYRLLVGDSDEEFGVQGWDPIDYHLTVMISRTASRETDGKRKFYPVPACDRFVSLARVESLVEALAECAGPDQCVECDAAKQKMVAMGDDLRMVGARLTRNAERARNQSAQVWNVAHMAGLQEYLMDPLKTVVDDKGQTVAL